MAKKNGPIIKTDLATSKIDAGDITAGYTSIRLNSPVPEENYSQLITRPGGLPVIPFFSGFNDFGQLLSLAIDISPVHAACVGSKARYTVGDGVMLKPGSRNVIREIVRAVRNAIGIPDKQKQRVELFLQNVNLNNEDIVDIAYRASYEFNGFGNAYIMIKRGMLFGKPIAVIHHIPTLQCLVEEKNDTFGAPVAVYISEAWQAGVMNVNTTEPDRVPIYPLWSEADGNGFERTVIHLKEYNSKRLHYGIPSSIASLQWQATEYKIPKFNNDNFDNRFAPSAMVQFFGAMNEDQKKRFLNDFHRTFTGDGKAGRIFAQVLHDKTVEAKVHTFEGKEQGQYLELDEIATQKIITAHNWHEVLAGIRTKGKLGGDSKEIRNAWEIAENTVIKYPRKTLARAITTAVMECLGHMYGDTGNYYLDFASTMPISFLGDIDPNAVLTRNEVREQAGFDVLRDEKGNESAKGFELIRNSASDKNSNTATNKNVNNA